jgi:hypothetical protein
LWAYNARCGSDRDCVLAVARVECRLGHSPAHCRIVERAQARARARREQATEHVLAPTGLDGVPGMTALAWCVSGRESGHDFTAATGNGFYGAYQFLPSTWQAVLVAMHAVGWPADPAEASPAEQTAAFDYYVQVDPGAWPESVPACGG